MEYEYMSIDAILAENQKMTCIFKTKIPEMGHLWGGTERDILPQSKYQVPVWMAYFAVYSGWADFVIPTPFGARVRNALDAEARSVRLSNLVGAGGLWYGFGKLIMEMVDDEQGGAMSAMLTTTFRQRLIELVDQAQHFAALGPSSAGGGGSGDLAQSFREGLDGTERELFVLAQESARRTKKWYEETDSGRR
ncbi:GINS complex, Psf3 component [Mucidula mucida]|nr:GINS complex, Psf3 component [Mucidula mucida]